VWGGIQREHGKCWEIQTQIKMKVAILDFADFPALISVLLLHAYSRSRVPREGRRTAPSRLIKKNIKNQIRLLAKIHKWLILMILNTRDAIHGIYRIPVPSCTVSRTVMHRIPCRHVPYPVPSCIVSRAVMYRIPYRHASYPVPSCTVSVPSCIVSRVHHVPHPVPPCIASRAYFLRFPLAK